ncbi:MAG: serine/threonine protein kinase [Deltaproteobacteria bacterium]|nr:serine/threonine protein kinase [Deltaproteobacteria bacterium]
MADTVGGRYTLDGHLGAGGMGRVYRARHTSLGKAFALKLISPAYALDGAARARFRQEAKLASEISHPNIVSVVDYGEDDAFGAYMVMELVEGEPLLGGIGPRGVVSLRRACDVLGQIADALDHIHRRGIVHGDVKADNIMLAPETDGTPRRRHVARLLDFGLARRTGVADEDHASGSPHYLAPERAAGGPPTVAADIYALGVLGYLMIAGTLPFEGNVVELIMAHIGQPPPPLALRRGEPVEDALEALIRRAMEKDPARRHASAATFRYELNAVMDMLAFGRRRRSAGTPSHELARVPLLAAAFERSSVPQALLAARGVIAHANHAFARLLGVDGTVEGTNLLASSLAGALPDLDGALRSAVASGMPVERRATVRRPDAPALELVAWFSPLPLPGIELHVLVRVEETS